jgi:hypothetical protein
MPYRGALARISEFNARRFFEGRYIAYRKGIAGENPLWAGWYAGELWFFDNFIIPSAKKLHDCAVFGVSYDEYLTPAQEIAERLRAEMGLKYSEEDI